MTIHQTISHTDRTLLPRSLLGRRHTYVATYRFKVGQTVMFRGERATVRDRQRSAKGREIYHIELVAPDERPFRVVMGESLGEDEGSPPPRTSGDPVREAARTLLLLPATDGARNELAGRAAA